MVGVTSPLFRRGDTRGGLALLGGYVAGTALAAAAILFALTVVSAARASAAVPITVQYRVLAACVALFLVLDLLGKTPHIDRQTGQRFRLLPAPVRGFIWGLDIGLLFTTIKVTSLVWVLLLLSVISPGAGVPAVMVFYASSLAIEGIAVLLDLRLGPGRVFSRLQAHQLKLGARAASVMLLVPVFIGLLSRAL